MQIKYKIIATNAADHSVTVRFYTDTLTEDMLAIRNPDTGEIYRSPDGSVTTCRTDYTITLWQVPTPQGQALVEVLSQYAPHQWFELQEKIANPLLDTSMTCCIEMLGVETDCPMPVNAAVPPTTIAVNTIDLNTPVV